MGTLKAKAIYCPKTEEHPRKKILLLLHENKLCVHCKDHGWISIELSKFGKLMDFDGTAVRVSSMERSTHFDLEAVPLVAIGEFDSIRKKNG